MPSFYSLLLLGVGDVSRAVSCLTSFICLDFSIYQSQMRAVFRKFTSIPNLQYPVGYSHSDALTVIVHICFVFLAMHVQHSTER
jgi:hypothetical protein